MSNSSDCEQRLQTQQLFVVGVDEEQQLLG